MNLRLDWLRQQGKLYKTADPKQREVISRNVTRHITRWDALTRCMLAQTFKKAGGSSL